MIDVTKLKIGEHSADRPYKDFFGELHSDNYAYVLCLEDCGLMSVENSSPVHGLNMSIYKLSLSNLSRFENEFSANDYIIKENGIISLER